MFSFCVWLLGLYIESANTNMVSIRLFKENENGEYCIKKSFYPLFLGVIITLSLLFYFKYYYIIAQFISRYIHINENHFFLITAPLGISFISFSVISYLIDIYRKDAVAGTFAECVLYIFFFPKIISGPIVLWRDFHTQTKNAVVELTDLVMGINLVCVGIAKKVILADTFGKYNNLITGQCIDTITAWCSWLLYALQIYYDFSGYSDIAIGLAKLFGFDSSKNFDFPYRATSITEFWRRWHISLGNFFKNYIYIPLGGNKKSKRRTLINLFSVFIITGIWHGAGMAYIIWGIVHGVCVIIERIVKDETWYQKMPRAIKWMITFFISASAWQFFRYGGNVTSAISSIGQLFGIHKSYNSSDIVFRFQFYFDNKIIVLMCIGVLGATILGNKRIIGVYNRIKNNNLAYLGQEIILMGLLIISISFMISSNYNPFIYFQF